MGSRPAVDRDETAAALASDGYTVLGELLDRPFLEELDRYSERRLAEQEAEHFERFSHHGSMISLDGVADPVVRRLVTLPRLRAALAAAGFHDVRWLSAYLISKPAHSPSLWWHQDWWAWEDPVSFADFPPQLFVMVYLRDVESRDGALRVIPGSHRTSHPLSRELPEAHGEEIEAAPRDSPAHRPHADEVTLAVRGGDAIIGDVRLLHATHPNQSDHRRSCLTLWYLPAWERLPEPIRAYVIRHPSLPPAGWWRTASHDVPAEIAALLPRYDGRCPPAAYRRRPPATKEARAGLRPVQETH
jgi:ectoine hydroxylase-related dioxygenase (phytanoyl-CoA dioxygenase family)